MQFFKFVLILIFIDRPCYQKYQGLFILNKQNLPVGQYCNLHVHFRTILECCQYFFLLFLMYQHFQFSRYFFFHSTKKFSLKLFNFLVMKISKTSNQFSQKKPKTPYNYFCNYYISYQTILIDQLRYIYFSWIITNIIQESLTNDHYFYIFTQKFEPFSFMSIIFTTLSLWRLFMYITKFK